MIPWEKLDQHLASMGKDRAWLAEGTPYSLESIRNAMAPASTRRSARMQEILSRAIEDEEARQAVPASRELRPGVFEIFQSEEQLHTADLASRIVGAPSIAAYCRDVILAESDRLLAANRSSRYPLQPPPQAAKVADGDEPGPNPSQNGT